ncbi:MULTISPECIES: DUF6755 family protein [unclassified Streptomyces]|uniref:DUF6755 family protein n=1 Tax=unclassified Streptomyces TaxID=2593676 RepID=UPI001E4A6467|nr:DUF6755 family protein [Streptomyces sp. CB02980]MCB8906363.1 hypothetical protein [Streptomyces sp. CB02980]
MTEDAFPRDPEAPEPAKPPVAPATPVAPGAPSAPSAPAAPAAPRPPAYTPGSAQPRLNRPVHERYPQIRPTSGYGDPRITHTGPGPGAGTEQEPERSSKLTARLTLALTVVIGQLWGLTIVVDEWMAGDTGTAWWGAGFLCLSFLVVFGLWLIDPKDR